MSNYGDQYETSKVLPKHFVSGWVVALIIASTGLSVSTLFLGSEVALNLGLEKALFAFGISTLVLTIMCMATTLIGNRTRLSTYMILHFSFGSNGAKIVNFILGITLVGWFAVTLELLSIAISDTAMSVFNFSVSASLVILITSFFITITTIYGIRSIEKLANISIPILTLFLGYVFYLTISELESVSQLFDYKPSEEGMTLYKSISILIGAAILFPVLMADFSRFIKTDKQSLFSVLGLAIGTPLAYLFSAVPSIHTGEIDIIKIMEAYKMVIPAFLLLFISTWTTNATNLYSASLTFSTINKRFNFRTIVLISSVLGTILALIGFANYLFDFLEFLGIFAPSISSIYFIHFFWVKKQQYDLYSINKWELKAMISWVGSSIITTCTYLNLFQLTHAYFIDSFLIGSLFYLILMRKQIQGKHS